jgi:hypothetical protein
MIALSRASGGRVPRNVISLATQGRLYVELLSNHKPGRLPRRSLRYTPDDIKSATEVMVEDIDGNILEIERPKHINKNIYVLTNAKPINELSKEDQELVSLLRLDEIKRHRELENLFADEERSFEEELALFLLLIED